MREHYMRPGEGFLLVYSITDRSSFQELEVFYEQILRVKDKDFFPMIVVGTKCDLEYDRQVDSSGAYRFPYSQGPSHCAPAEGRALAAKLRGRHIETSAKMRINVDAAFTELVKLIKSYEKVSCLSCLGDHGPNVCLSRSNTRLVCLPGRLSCLNTLL